MITILRDLNDNPGATETWRAAAFRCPNPVGTDHQSWAVAWGKCYAQMTSGIRPLGWHEDSNTDVDGVQWFDSEAEALEYLSSVEDAARISA